MVEFDPKYLDTFPAWLDSLGRDAATLGTLLGESGLSGGARESIAGGLNYLFKSLDLIPDGIDDIGYLDDAFVLRVSAELAIQEDLAGVEAEKLTELHRLAGEADVVREFLGKDFARLLDYVKGLRKSAARGRAVSEIVRDESTRLVFLQDLQNF